VVIHSVVDFSKKRLVGGRFAKLGPTLAGLACIPLLPVVDEPVERAVEFAFDELWPAEHKSESKKHA